MVGLLNRFQDLLDRSRIFDFLPLLALRIYLVPIFWMAGSNKWSSMDSTIEWFGNPDWGLGLPFPTLMAYLATLTELFGAVFLAIGFMVRWISIPLMVTMIVAMVSVHWQNGWLAIAEGTGIFATERTEGAIVRLDKAKEILQQHGNYDWLSQNGNFVVLNNGIEFAATYFIMLLVLFFFGAGRFFSLDYWIARGYRDNRR